jgi:hypothetical protein
MTVNTAPHPCFDKSRRTRVHAMLLIATTAIASPLVVIGAVVGIVAVIFFITA